MAEERAPGRTSGNDFENTGGGIGVRAGLRRETSRRLLRFARHAHEPERKPEKTDGAEKRKVGTPAETLHQNAAEKKAESGAGTDAGVDEGVREAAMTFGKMADDDVCEAGIGDGFSDAEKKPAEEKKREAAGEAGEKRCSGPEREADSENFCGGKFVSEPAGENQEGSVRPEKSGEQDAELRSGKGKFALDCGDGDGESAAVDVGDEEREEEEGEDGPEGGGEFFGCR